MTTPSIKVAALLGETGVSRENYAAAIDRIRALGTTIPARRRAAFGYALALQDREAEVPQQQEHRPRWYQRPSPMFWLGWATALVGGLVGRWLAHYM